MRTYGQFLEEFQFDAVAASELFEEANIIEEENLKKNSRFNNKRASIGSNMAHRKSVYDSELRISLARGASQEDLHNAEMNFESISNEGDVQPNVLRSAVNKKEEHQFLYTFISSLGFVGISFILVVLILGVVISETNNTNITLVEKSCAVSSRKFITV